jgi:hypothetical protein
LPTSATPKPIENRLGKPGQRPALGALEVEDHRVVRASHKPTGRGDDYLDLTGQPLFPFGFG